MGVDVRGGAGLGMAQLLGYHHQGNAVGDHQCGVGVTQAVDCDLRYCSDHKAAIARKNLGQGRVYLIGLDFGRCYCERPQKPVPVAYGREAQYPLTMIKRTPVEAWVTELGLSDHCQRGIERVRFENGVLYINHTPYDFTPEEPYAQACATGGFDGVLHGHRSVFLTKCGE